MPIRSIQLQQKSHPQWVACVRDDFDSFLKDHTDCERKAASTAMAMISRFPEYPSLVEPMVALAREELAHFHIMYKLCKDRGITYTPNQKDPYIEKLRKMVRHPDREYFLDRLLIAAVIESRAHERLEAITPHVPEEYHRLYHRLAKEEAAHESVFLRLAGEFFDTKEVEDRLSDFEEREGQILDSIPIRPAIH